MSEVKKSSTTLKYDKTHYFVHYYKWSEIVLNWSEYDIISNKL